MIYITGDTHGDFYRLYKSKFNKNDMMIIAGDSGINYFDNNHQFTKECKTNIRFLHYDIVKLEEY